MGWKLARSLEDLRTEINTAYPKRSKVADGTIGDAAHSSRTSDHNPDSAGVVRGMDITHDPAIGVDSYMLARMLVANPDRRLKYVISNSKIASREHGWQWRPYNGANAHKHHVHISVMPGALGDEPGPWGIAKIAEPVAAAKPAGGGRPVLRKGAKGDFVKTLQKALKILADGDFGDGTDKAVRLFQTTHGLLPDGIVGPSTWDAIDKQ